MKLIDEKSLTLDQYQGMASRTAIYPGRGTFLGLMYVVGKLNGEAGEAAEQTFKALRDDEVVTTFSVENGVKQSYVDSEFATYEATGMVAANVTLNSLNEERRKNLLKELGDVLWYVSQIANELGFTLGEVAVANIAKLVSRQERDVLHGSGDDR